MSEGENIKRMRAEKGLTMKEFGGMFVPPASDSIVSRWERGVSIPNASRMKQITEMRNRQLENYSTDELVKELIRRGELPN